MKRNKILLIIFVMLFAAACAWAFTLETNGHHDDAAKFVEEAGTAFAAMLVFGLIFGVFNEYEN